MGRFIEPVTLRGAHATLEPLAPAHADALARAAADGELWRPLVHVRSPRRTTDARLRRRGARRCASELGAMPFVVRDNASGDVVGSTRYFNVDAANRRLEIGHTWYAKRVQRTAINTECKLLLLTHAFETLAASPSSSARTGSTHAVARGDRAARREAGRRAAQPPAAAGRQPARHRRVQHHRQRMAGGEAPSAVPAAEAALTVAATALRARRRGMPAPMLIGFFLHLKSFKLPVSARASS